MGEVEWGGVNGVTGSCSCGVGLIVGEDEGEKRKKRRGGRMEWWKWNRGEVAVVVVVVWVLLWGEDEGEKGMEKGGEWAMVSGNGSYGCGILGHEEGREGDGGGLMVVVVVVA